MWCVQYYICHPQTSVTRIDRFDHPDETLPTGGAIPPQPDIAGTAPGLPSAPKKDIVNELCPYFQWMPVGNDCTLQVLTGADRSNPRGRIVIQVNKTQISGLGTTKMKAIITSPDSFTYPWNQRS